MHTYYEEDQDNAQRMRYFDQQFLQLAEDAARRQGIPLSAYLSQITNFTTFKNVLEEAFDEDASLSYYVDGMSNNAKKLFFERAVIQKIVESNLEEKPEKIAKIKIPDEVRQVKGKTRVLFKATLIEKETGMVRKVVAKKTFVVVKGKRQVRFRDSRGRFVRRS